MTFKNILPGLSRTLSFNFQDFPGHGILKKKIQDFPGNVTCIYGIQQTRRCQIVVYKSSIKTETKIPPHSAHKQSTQDRNKNKYTRVVP